ncbi:glycosyltransferase family 39 protein [Sphingomonas aliaeris]|uniref:Glycosyltransferase family 39 protein n=1 Tax=Sphingomonas aliaeris TaxID=2759526 RepID=A0A974S2X2_9SPHN|nr:glycosyltransferase family 39 protein [Sphingomonas aliaeris]QQV75881.1 glycosyltransferase family 39 protein [Sphingomonas aliaeris]
MGKFSGYGGDMEASNDRRPPLPVARLWPWLVALAAVLIAFLSLGHLWWIPAQAALNVNEGWNAGQAVRALGAGPLYPDPNALIANNYPPLSFFVVGAIGWLSGDMIIAGRIVALLAQIANGMAVFLIVRRLSDRNWAMLGAMIFAAYSVTLLRNYVAINDPQWLGQAAMSWAVVMLMPRNGGERISVGATIAAAAMVVAGVLVKHNLVAFPAAITVWLWFHDRRALQIWIVTGLVIGGAAIATVFAIWGVTIFTDVLSPARSYSVARMAAKGGPLLLLMLPVVLAIRPIASAWKRDGRLALPILLLAISVPLGIVQRSGSGVDVNAFFEAIVALSIAVPVGCALRSRVPYHWLGLAALPALCLVPVAAAKTVADLTGREEAVRDARPFIAAIAKARGPVACDDQAICYWAGRQSAIDFFSVKQRLLQKEAAALVPTLARSHFALIQMRSENPGWQENLLIPTIRAHYRTVFIANSNELLVPKPQG